MNLLDLFLALLVVAAATTGYRLGLAARAVSWVGALVGLALSTLTVPLVLDVVGDTDSATMRLFIGLVVVLVTVSITGAIGDVVGLRLRRRVQATSLGPLDQAAGGLAGGLSILVLLWFLLPAMADTPGTVARQVRGSTVVELIDLYAPRPPDAARALERLIDRSGFPDVFADLRPAPETGPPPSEIPVPQDVVATATTSTVNIEAFGCGNGFEGSGFVVADGLVATNAHVIAGATEIGLRRTDGSVVPATVQHSDPDRDLALLSAPEVGRPPLSLREGEVGEQGATIGYPGGQDTPRVAPASIADERATVGRGLYGGLVERQVLFLSASLRQGDSGSPMIGADGAVIGVVFAVSPDDPDSAYALHVDELREVLAATPNGDAGACR